MRSDRKTCPGIDAEGHAAVRADGVATCVGLLLLRRLLLLSLRRVAEDGSVLLCLPNPERYPDIPLAAGEEQYNSDCIFPTFLQGMFFAQVFGWLWTVQWLDLGRPPSGVTCLAAVRALSVTRGPWPSM